MRCLVLLGMLFISTSLLAQETSSVRVAGDGPFVPEPALVDGIVLPLYSQDSDKLNHQRIHEAERYNTTTANAGRLLNTLNIHNPTIEVHLAEKRAENGTAVIVAPGGGHKILWVGPEGYDLVPFFDEVGVSTIVLRNRLRVDGYEPTTDAVNDAFQAIRIVRAHAAEWDLDPNRIGFIGFSAGAELAAPTALFYDAFAKQNGTPDDPLGAISPRPDFVGLVYPGPTPFTREPETKIPANVPPSYLVCAGADDKVHAIWAADYFNPMLNAGVPNLEMHIYARGGHGGSISSRNGSPFGTWPATYIAWMRDLGFLEPAGVETRAAKEVRVFANRVQESRKDQ